MSPVLAIQQMIGLLPYVNPDTTNTTQVWLGVGSVDHAIELRDCLTFLIIHSTTETEIQPNERSKSYEK